MNAHTKACAALCWTVLVLRIPWVVSPGPYAEACLDEISRYNQVLAHHIAI